MVPYPYIPNPHLYTLETKTEPKGGTPRALLFGFRAYALRVIACDQWFDIESPQRHGEP